MKRMLLIVTHLGTISTNLCYTLDKNKKFQWINKLITYDHPIDSIDVITSMQHKYNDSIGVYVNEVFYNYQIAHKDMTKTCDYLFLIDEPKNSFRLLESKRINYFLDYYIFRLRRIYELAKVARNALFLTCNELKTEKGIRTIENFLGINLEQIPQQNKVSLDFVPVEIIKRAEKAYELCIYRINNTQVLRC